MRPLVLSRDHARRFLVRRHLLDPARRLRPEPASVLAVVERLGSLQFDPLEVPGARNHDLVLHARIDGHLRSFCGDLLYAPAGERRLFEAYNKSLNILPLHELPYYRLTWERARQRYDAGFLREHAAAKRTILKQIRDGGPITSQAVSRDMGAAVDWHWGKNTQGKAVLEALFETGRISIARREGNRRFYDLTERLFPAELLARRVSRAEAMRHRLLSRYRGVGLMGAHGSSELTLRAGTAPERAAMTLALVADGTLIKVDVEGVKGPRYVLAEELPIVEATATSDGCGPSSVVFLAPLDPLVWDRKLVEALFGFVYRWEVYTPVAKREHGYYVLPLLFGERLVGRIEPRLERETRALHIVSITFEPGFDALAEAGFAAALGDALRAYQGLTGATKVVWPRTRIARALAKAILPA
jgi:uncharacterized protein YcaQ